MPLVRTKVPATPSTELEPNVSFVPLRVTLKRFAVPESDDVPLNVVVPAVADNEPATDKSEAREKLFVVETEPVTLSALRAFVPAPLMVLPVPLIVMLPALAEREPLVTRFPPMPNEVAVLTEPDTVR